MSCEGDESAKEEEEDGRHKSRGRRGNEREMGHKEKGGRRRKRKKGETRGREEERMCERKVGNKYMKLCWGKNRFVE